MPRPPDPTRAASTVGRRARTLWRTVRGVLARTPEVRRLAPVDAYRLWSETYDAQPDNVILALEQEIFRGLLSDVSLAGKAVVDVGCGTGRHWDELLAGRPGSLAGVDSSPEMLDRLRARHPEATLVTREGEGLHGFADGSVDVLVSTLVLGHVRGLEVELREWARIVPPGGEMIVTDFHPEAFQAGMKRTFTHGGATFEVEHQHRTLPVLRGAFRAAKLDVVRFVERTLDPSARGSFERQGHRDAFRQHLGTPLVLGFLLRRT